MCSLFVLAGFLVGCIAPIEPLEEGDEREPIVGGAEEWGFPLVGALAGDSGGGLQAFCTATPVTPTVLITAAHCLDAFNEFGGNVVFARITPDGRGPTHAVRAASRRTHPQWQMYHPCLYVFDVGVVNVDRVDTKMFPQLHHRALTAGDVGTRLKVVGFGVSSPPSGGAGTKRSIDMQVTDLVTDHVPVEFGCTSPPRPYNYQFFTMVLGSYYNGVCYGDSGGPSFVQGEYRDIQYGVHARTQVEQCGPAEDTSVGYFFESFLRSTVLSLDPTAEDCGDGICTGLEREETCATDCSPFTCGDSVQQGPEACDDGNTVSGDGCSADCRSEETCPNGIADTAVGEVCDDGNTASGDGCSPDCRSNETCGNGIADGPVGEVCDDGNTQGGDGCSADCRSTEVCGNGIRDIGAGEIYAGEACDDGNRDDGDGCSADCRSDETCGNGFTDRAVGEVCDDGNVFSGDGCSADCRIAEGCGDGVLDFGVGEVCDDGNTRDRDGCSANCRSDETCGNGVRDTAVGETCDDGNRVDDDGCPSDCGAPRTSTFAGLVGSCGCRTAGAPSGRAARFSAAATSLLLW